MDNDARGIGPIAKLPVFLDLAGRRAVLAGDSNGIAWKAELIAAAGADVTVFMPAASEALERLAAAGVAAGSLHLVARRWQESDLAGAALATGDFEDTEEAEAFHAAAHRAGVIVNTVDKAATCDFFFGSIVSRSPIVIGITTNGTAPILGQAVRRTIEAALPRWLADWAALAARIRASVKTDLAPGPERRRFWEAFVDRAFAAPPTGTDESARAAVQAAGEAEGSSGGRLTEIAVPCENPECLRMRDVRAMQAADLIVMDAGLPDGVSALCRREAERLMIDEARRDLAAATIDAARRQGRTVVRLTRAMTCAGC